jgi:C_GCAxxG_C_C family probable redox protein
MDRAKMAVENMRGGLNCAQSVVKAYSSELEVPEDAAVKMATPFGGGFGRRGFVCGALSGAGLVIGAKFGNCSPADTAKRDKTYAAVGELLEKFRQEHGAVFCRELIGFDLWNPDEMKRAREKGVFTNQCPLFVKSAARILEKILSAKQD